MARISIGLPVYNGERFIRDAIDSILGQTYRDFDLIISDNASTDGTEAICRAYAEADERVHYIRQVRNIGAGPNFNVVFEKSHGEYFKWVAHDDLIESAFLEKCVEVLDRDPSVVLASARTKIIDQWRNPLGEYDYQLNADSEDVVERFRNQIRGHQCYEIFGVVRRSALEQTPLMGNYFAGDAMLLIRLVIQGKFYEVPEPLFTSRRHEQQSEQMLRHRAAVYMEWFDPNHRDKITLPYWRVAREYFSSLRSRHLKPSERIKCGFYIVVWMARRWRMLCRDLAKASAKMFDALTTRGGR